MTEDRVRLDVDGPVAVITNDNPDKKNAFDDAMDARLFEILAELQCVDYLVSFSEPTAHALLEAVRPDVYVKGGDYAPEEINEYDLVQRLGLQLRVLAHRPGLSSTDVIARLRED